jgi:hypothetical protein
MTFFMELDMSYYIHMTHSYYYAEELFHVNPELCFFILVVEEYYIIKYANQTINSKPPPASSGSKKLKKVKVEGGTYDAIEGSGTTNDQQKSLQPSKTANSLTSLISETDVDDNVVTGGYDKVGLIKGNKELENIKEEEDEYLEDSKNKNKYMRKKTND